MRCIAIRKIDRVPRPRDIQHRVIKTYAPFGRRRIRCRVQIKQSAIRFKRLKPVREPFRDDHHPHVARAQLFRMPLQEGRRIFSEIDGNVPDPSLKTTDQLHFGMRGGLKVQAPNRANRSRDRLIDLRDPPVTEDLRKLLIAKQTGEASPLVGEWCRLGDKQAVDRCCVESHSLAPCQPMVEFSGGEVLFENL